MTTYEGHTPFFDRDYAGKVGNAPVYVPPVVPPPFASGMYELSTDYGADNTGVIDATTSLNLALAAGSTFTPKGTYKVLGTVTIDPSRDFLAAGSGMVTFKLGPSGQIKIGDPTVNTPFVGGHVGGFKLDGQTTQNVAGGALHVGFCLKKHFADLWIQDTAGDGIVIETAQNCTFDTIQVSGAGRSCLVFDLGAGGHTFYNPELNPLARHAIEFRQTGTSFGGYPAFLGPSNNTFWGGIAEYGNPTSLQPLVYHGAGTNNQFYGFSVCPTGRTVVGAAAILMESAANAYLTTATITAGSASFTVANPANISALMAARVPGFEAGSVVASVVGNVVTLFDDGTGANASFPAGTVVSFGAESAALTFDGLVSPGSDGYTYGIETRGNAQVTLTGRSTFTNHIAAIKAYSNDKVTIDGPVSYFGSTIPFVAHPSNDTGVTPTADVVMRGARGAGTDIITAADAAARGLRIQRFDQQHPNFVVYPGGVRVSDGTVDPVTTGFAFSHDTPENVDYFYAFSALLTPFLKLSGVAGATGACRMFGLEANPGSPTGGAWRAGDMVIDANGAWWLCTVAGTPGTWTSPTPAARPAYVAPAYAANVGNYALGDAFGSSRGVEHLVVMRGALITSAAFAANATLATLTATHRPSSAIVLGTGVKYDSGGIMTVVPISVDSSGLVQCKVALASGDALFMDSFTYHAA